jgi:hypothetical protein
MYYFIFFMKSKSSILKIMSTDPINHILSTKTYSSINWYKVDRKKKIIYIYINETLNLWDGEKIIPHDN